MRQSPAAIAAAAVACGILIGDRVAGRGLSGVGGVPPPVGSLPPDCGTRPPAGGDMLPALALASTCAAIVLLALARRSPGPFRASALGLGALALAALAGGLGILSRSAPPARATRGWFAVLPRSSAPLDDGRDSWTLELIARRSGPPGDPAWVPGSARLRATINRDAGIVAGVPVLLRGSVEPPGPPRNPGEHDRRSRDRREGFAGWLRVDRGAAPRPLPEFAQPGPERILEPIRRAARGTIEREFRGDSRTTLLAILFAEKDAGYRDVVRPFRQAGVTHVLALSGMHLAFVGAILLFPVRFASRRSGVRTALLLGSFLVFTLLVHAPASLVRATAGASLFLVARWASRSPSALHTVWAMLLLLFLAAPPILFDLSFRLSAGAVLGMLLVAEEGRPHLDRLPLPRPARWLALAFLGTAGALLGTAPFTIQAFGQSAILAPVANLFAIPVSGLVVMAGEVALLSTAAHLPSAHALWGAVALLLEIFLAGVEAIAAWEPFRGPIPVPPGWAVPGAFALLAALAVLPPADARRPERTRRASAPATRVAIALGLAGAIAWCRLLVPPERRAPAVLAATVLDVGQGDAILLEFPGGETWLVDGGSARRGDPGERILIPVLRAKGIRRLDAVLLSHAHEDHYGGLRTLLDRVPAGALLETGIDDGGRGIGEIRSTAMSRRAPIRRVRAGERFLLREGARVEILAPGIAGCAREPVPASRLNDCSVAFLVRWRETIWLFPGDLERPGEEALLGPCAPPRVGFLKAGHHGSATSSAPALLARLRPECAAVSVGAGNRFGHPSRVVLSRLACAGARVLRTDQVGAVRVVSDGSTTVMEGTLSPPEGICYPRARSRVPASRREGRRSA